MSIVLAVASAVGAYNTVGVLRMLLGALAIVFVITTVLSFMGKLSCKCCGESCAPTVTAKPVAKKAAKKKKQ